MWRLLVIVAAAAADEVSGMMGWDDGMFTLW